jgi:hypothetical protein
MDEEQAWEIIEEEIRTSYTGQWLFSTREFAALKKCIASYIN